MSIRKKIPLLGADKFIMALEYHDKYIGSTGNICQYIMEIEPNFNEENFIKELKENSIIQWLSKLFLISKNSNYWKVLKTNKSLVNVKIHKHLYYSDLKRKNINIYEPPLFHFEIFKKEKNKTTIVLSWHHILMDEYGANLLINNLVNPIKIKSINRQKSKLNFKTIIKSIKAKNFLNETSKGEIALMASSKSNSLTQNTSITLFTEEETKKITKNAKLNGDIFGTSSYLLAATSIALNKYRVRENLPIKDFWVPIPKNNRKKGENWPILGNHISFLFYRLKKEEFLCIKNLTKSIVKQMTHQIQKDNTTNFNHLMNFLRNISPKTYSKLIKGPNGEDLSSFLFTVASIDNKEVDTFFDGKIINQYSIPPNPYPPGLTFSFNFFKKQLNLTVQSYREVIDDKKIKKLETHLKEILI